MIQIFHATRTTAVNGWFDSFTTHSLTMMAHPTECHGDKQTDER